MDAPIFKGCCLNEMHNRQQTHIETTAILFCPISHLVQQGHDELEYNGSSRTYIFKKIVLLKRSKTCSVQVCKTV